MLGPRFSFNNRKQGACTAKGIQGNQVNDLEGFAGACILFVVYHTRRSAVVSTSPEPQTTNPKPLNP